MKLTRPLCVLDIESACAKSRPDAAVDRIICLAIAKLNPNSDTARAKWLFNPGVVMSAENMAIHGFTNEQVVTYPPMDAHHAESIAHFISGCDLAGFNLLNYDVPLLWEECHRVGAVINLDGVHIVDAGNIFKKKEERSLTAALKFYCGRDHTGAHGAEADVDATISVLEAQRRGEKYFNLPPSGSVSVAENLMCFHDSAYDDIVAMDVPALAAYSKMDDRIDLFGTIVRNEKGEAVFNTKRNQGVRVIDDIGYAQWFVRNDFPAHTKMTIKRILNGGQQDDGQLF